MRNRISKKLLYCLLAIALVCLVYSVLPASAAQAAELKLPSGLKRIEAQAFYGDTSLDTVTIQEGTEVIGKEAFANSSVQTVTLPSTLYSIGEDAFSGCENLTVNAQEGTYAYTWAVTNKYINIPDGEAGAVTQVIAPETLRAGADLTIQIIGPADTIHHSVYVVNEQTEEYQIRQSTKARDTVTFSGYNFVSGSTYRLTVYTVTRQYQSLTPVRKTLQVVGQKPVAPIISLPESIKTQQYIEYENPFNCDMRMAIDYFSNEGVSISSEMCFIDPDSSYSFSSGYYEGLYESGGTIQVSYTAYLNGLWTEWSDRHTIQVIKPLYIFGEIDFPDTVENGQEFSINFECADNVDYCYCIISQGESYDIRYSTYMSENGVNKCILQISTLRFEQGNCLFRLYLKNEEDNEEYLVYQKSFEIVGTRSSAPTVSVNKKEVRLNSDVVFAILNLDSYLISAQIVAPYDEEPHYCTIETSGSITQWGCWVDWYGTYTLSFSVLKGDKWSAWTDPIEILVQKDPPLSPPNLYVSSPIYAGKDWTFSFDEVENATHYSATIKQSQYSDRDLYTLDPATPTDLQEVPGYILSNGNYVLEVNASAENYITGTKTKTVSITGQRPTSPEMTVSEPIHAGQEVVFSFDTTNVDALQVKYMNTYYGYYRSENSSSIPVTGETTKWPLTIDPYSRGYYLSISWSAKSNDTWSEWQTQTYLIEENLRLDPATIHLSDAPYSGNYINITVDPVPYATRYECSLYNEEGIRVWGRDFSSAGNIQIYSGQFTTGEYTFIVKAGNYPEYLSSTSQQTFIFQGIPSLSPAVIHVDDIIEAGKDFSITVDAVENATSYEYQLYYPNGYYSWNSKNATIGQLDYSGLTMEPGEYRFKVWAYSDDYATSTSEKAFTIVGNKPTAPLAQVNKTVVKAQEYYTFTIDTNYADALKYRVGSDGPNSINVLESETQWTTYSYYGGIYEYSFSVRRNGIWSAWSEPITITVTDYDPLGKPTISIISPLESGRDLVVSFSSVPNAQYYNVYLNKTDGTLSLSRYFNPGNDFIATFPGYQLDPGTYQIRVYVSDYHSSSNAYATVTLTALEKPSAPVVTPPENTTVQSGSYITFTIDSTDADMIAVRNYVPGYTNDVSYSTHTVQEGQTQTAWQMYFSGTSKKYSFAVHKNGIWSEWSSFTTIIAAQNSD